MKIIGWAGWTGVVVGALALGLIGNRLWEGHKLWKTRTPMCEDASAINYKIRTKDGDYIRTRRGESFTYKERRFSVLKHTKAINASGGLFVRQGEGEVKLVAVVPRERWFYNRFDGKGHEKVEGLAFEGWTCEKPAKAESPK